jgi:neutral ceramidase
MGPYFLYNDTDGMMDETVAVTFLRRADHSVLGGMVNYACHPVALGDDELHMSRDFVHFTLETLEAAWGPGAVPLFLQGCAGNINPRWIYDDASRDPPPDRVLPVELAPRLAETARIGRILGGAALAASQSILTFSGTATLAGVSRTIELPLREDLPAGMIGTPGHAAAAAPAVRTRYLGMGQTMSAGMKSVTTEVQVLRVGESLVIGLPGEIFVEWQVRIRERLGARHVSVVELANDSVSYIPTPEAFTEGGYEPLVSFFAPEAGAIIVSAAVEAAESLLEG